ncbi:hypothetical protein OUZ56_012600 [Daphnia magna]|uniref:Uncharacterized protein n=1 Tax=Daphnia magna TaxID=35525 RepID=A0ABQ9Z3J1_9CRUS|nr:hypothetical protein OUZ56_012600 [Daphnia magna]
MAIFGGMFLRHLEESMKYKTLFEDSEIKIKEIEELKKENEELKIQLEQRESEVKIMESNLLQIDIDTNNNVDTQPQVVVKVSNK